MTKKRKDYVDEIVKNESGRLQLKNYDKYLDACDTCFVEGSKVRVTVKGGILQVKSLHIPEGTL